MDKGEFREFDRGWLRVGPSILAVGSDVHAWAGFRRHLASDDQRSLFDMWLDKSDGHQLPQRSDFSNLEILPMTRLFYTLEYDAAARREVHRFIGTAYADAIGYEIDDSDHEQAHFRSLGYTTDEQDWLMGKVYQDGCPSLHRYSFDQYDKSHQGSIDLTLPVRRTGADHRRVAIGVGFYYGID